MMPENKVLGIDTSNYTTSLAIIEEEKILQKKKLLPVKKGELGLRQSDAVSIIRSSFLPLWRS